MVTKTRNNVLEPSTSVCDNPVNRLSQNEVTFLRLFIKILESKQDSKLYCKYGHFMTICKTKAVIPFLIKWSYTHGRFSPIYETKAVNPSVSNNSRLNNKIKAILNFVYHCQLGVAYPSNNAGDGPVLSPEQAAELRTMLHEQVMNEVRVRGVTPSAYRTPLYIRMRTEVYLSYMRDYAFTGVAIVQRVCMHSLHSLMI